MEKLTIEHLTPYLPYNLKVYDSYSDSDAFLAVVSINNIGIAKKPHYRLHIRELNEIKPILKPLSDFCGKITGSEIRELLKCDHDSVIEIWRLKHSRIKLEDISYATYKIMCRNHIDFNNLIDSGLAIDINSI